ncbi:GAF domain-containing protein [Natronomonas halophila]|uniref:GAF domain-containing protein n=1 Tax=Natronomonas halophila TaxID=2747817 RepID=UPI0015B44659|nr:GAF domain-containing protein [Natronomonas halophila]QLD85061.1 GAF domain-containing protein [Natronomonas halophila]
MAHSICTPEAGGELPYFQRLWRTLLAPNIDPKSRTEQLFDHETIEFDLEYAFLSYIDLEHETERFDITHGSHEALNPGTTIPLSKTYCRKTIADPEGTLAISDAIAEGWEDDPAYEAFGISSYLGTTVSVDDELYGTLCFANTAPRDDPIRDEEKALVEMHGQWVGHTLDLWEGPPIREQNIDRVEKRVVSSDAIDSMMDALRKPTRRVILMALLDDTTETTIATLERKLNHEHARMRLAHSDLPKLANAGYITWDNETETISKGPRFSEVEPLVQLLHEYNTAFPE